jgi:transmembrane sensor
LARITFVVSLSEAGRFLVRVNPDSQAHPEELLGQALRGELDPANQAILDRHLASCPDCALELRSVRAFAASGAPGDRDDALDRAIVEGVLARLEQPEGLGGRLRRWLGTQRRRRTVAALAVLGAAAAFAFALTAHLERQGGPVAVTSPAKARTLVLNDGSEIEPLGGTMVKVEEQSTERTTLQLRSGSAEFRVRHNPRRTFRVDAGPILIEDLGTAFVVDHQAGGKVHVAVSEGRVAVLSVASGVRVELRAGEDRVFPVLPEPIEGPLMEVDPPRARDPATATGTSHGQIRPRGVEDATTLLQAADHARRSRHPEAAVAPLRRLIERFPKDPRAPSAAFTLGWVLLTDLSRAREAAAAFAEAERNAPRGLLAEDAAARVAEAWQKAGDVGRAAQAARHYEQMYPSGRYITLMRGLIGEP